MPSLLTGDGIFGNQVVGQLVDSSATCTTSGIGVWQNWVTSAVNPRADWYYSDGTASATTSIYGWEQAVSTVVWRAWTSNNQTAEIGYEPAWRGDFVPSRPMSAIERAAMQSAERETRRRLERQRRETHRMLKEREKKAIEASRKSRSLLMQYLTDAQREELLEKSYFIVKGSEGGLYAIYKGSSGNVSELKDGKRVSGMCIHPNIWTPDFDTMLAQKMHLETDEKKFRKVANITRYRNPQPLEGKPLAA